MRRAILERCQELGLTQRQLARLIGVDEATVSDYVVGRAAPSLRVALRMGRVLDAPVEDLFADLVRPKRGGGAVKQSGPAPEHRANDRAAATSVPQSESVVQ